MEVLLASDLVSKNFRVRNVDHSRQSPAYFFPDQQVTPGKIIVRQRGTLFHPGQHVCDFVLDIDLSHSHDGYQVKMGRDHTIYAVAPGFVRFYKEKWMRGTRRFVGVVLERGEVLPRDEAERGRSRYFGLVNVDKPSPVVP